MTHLSSPPVQDHWQVLGLEPGADQASLKRAFRDQARRWHPDLNGNDPRAEERFKRINEAYAVLSDPQRRRAWEAGEGADGTAAAPDPFATGFPGFEQYLDALFGRRRRAADPMESSPDWPRGETPQADEAAEGTPPAPDSEPGRASAAAPRADGSRRSPSRPAESWQSESWHSDEVRPVAAPPPPPPVVAAHDQESLVELTPEQALHGARIELELADGTLVEVSTPPLAGDGWRLRLAGLAPGGGDHFLQLRVRTTDGLRLDGLRVSYVLELSPADAVLGAQVVVPTLEGPVRLRVPPRSSSGRLLRLRGRGQRLGDQVGDQLVEVRIVVPEALSDAEQALYGRLRELEAEEKA